MADRRAARGSGELTHPFSTRCVDELDVLGAPSRRSEAAGSEDSVQRSGIVYDGTNGLRVSLQSRTGSERQPVPAHPAQPMHLIQHPPKIDHALTWRRLYLGGAFAQRDLMASGTFRDRAKDRGTRLGIGDGDLKYLYEVGALRPVAFSCGPYWSGFTSPSEPAEQLTFSTEEIGRPWTDNEYELHGHPHVSALYTAWQQLPASDARRAGTFTVPLWVVTGEAEVGARGLEQVRGWAEAQDGSWRALDDAWRPLLQVLVRLQNRYWPELTGRTTLLFDPESRERFDPYERERGAFEPRRVLDEDLGGDRAGVLAAYHFLVDRGLDLDPRDGLTMLRRARRRDFHIRWRGDPRLAQDHFDAADILRRFLFDVEGRQPPQPDAVPMDGRQDVREALYVRGPGAEWDGRAIVAELQEADLYPHGVHIVHEGDTDERLIAHLIADFIGSSALEEVNFTDLHGAGNAAVVEDLVGSLEAYARRTVVVLDNEANAREHVEALIAAGAIPREDALLLDTSLEEANSSPVELVELAIGIAAGANVGLAINVDEFLSFHDHAVRTAREKKREPPSLSTSLERVISRATRGAWHLRKPDLVDALARRLSEEAETIPPAESSRPIVRFIAERIIPPLNRPYPLGAS